MGSRIQYIPLHVDGSSHILQRTTVIYSESISDSKILCYTGVNFVGDDHIIKPTAINGTSIVEYLAQSAIKNSVVISWCINGIRFNGKIPAYPDLNVIGIIENTSVLNTEIMKNHQWLNSQIRWVASIAVIVVLTYRNIIIC